MDLSEVLRRRRMVRNFRAEGVAPQVVDGIVAAGLRAPSAGNTQALDVVVLDGAAQTARYWDVSLPLQSSARAGFRWPGLLAAPVLLVVCVSPEAYLARYSEPDKAAAGLGDTTDAWPVPYWFIDAGGALLAMQLAVVDAGLGCCLFGAFSHEPAVCQALGIPPSHRIAGVLALGHPLPDEPGRSAARARRGVDEVVHRGGW